MEDISTLNKISDQIKHKGKIDVQFRIVGQKEIVEIANWFRFRCIYWLKSIVTHAYAATEHMSSSGKGVWYGALSIAYIHAYIYTNKLHTPYEWTNELHTHTHTQAFTHLLTTKCVCACVLCMFEREELNERVYVAINIVRVIVYQWLPRRVCNVSKNALISTRSSWS